MLSPHEVRLRYMGLLYVVLFCGATAVFVLFPTQLFAIINAISNTFFPQLPLATDGGTFWRSLTISMMATIIALSFFIYINVQHYYVMAIPLIIAKFTSSLCGIAYFLGGFIFGNTNTLANLIIFLTDFPLGIVAYFLWRNVKNSKKST